MLARELNDLGIRTVTGNLIVAPTFTMNFDGSALRAGRQLFNALDASRRPAAATQAWMEERTRAGDVNALRLVPSVTIDGSLQLGPAPAGASLLFTHRSSQLVDILKVLLCYSNNFMAERLGDTLGGIQTVRQLLISRLKLNPEDFKLASLSGLGVNRVTPRAMMTILRALRAELARQRLAPSDIMPVAGIDPGTLEDRYTSPEQRGSVIAKTGTLISTDRGASSLVGQTQTREGVEVLFVIFNQRGSVINFRANQDQIVNSLQSALGGPAPFSYRPVALAMRLSDTENEPTKSKPEFEPKNH
jgi:D-alanyl-D-alanine carboxypeptidase